MGPKKKAAQKKQAPVENPPKPAAEEVKKQVKQTKQVKQPLVNEPKQPQQKKQPQKPEQKKPAQPKIVRTESDSQKKLNLGQTEKLSEAQLIERRKLRFNLVGTEVNAQQAQKIKKQRLQKFGAVLPESKEDLQKRRQKFAPTNSLNQNQDQAVIDKRREKFGGTSTLAAQDPSVVEERKKKFGSNDVNLDQQIQKSKQKHKNSHQGNRHRDNLKRSKPHYHHSRQHYNPNQKRRR